LTGRNAPQLTHKKLAAPNLTAINSRELTEENYWVVKWTRTKGNRDDCAKLVRSLTKFDAN